MSASSVKRTALVTGVSSGIGREIARMLVERGARVFGTVRDPRSADPLPGVELVRMEVTDDASVSEAVQGVVRKAGPVHQLVNNAGYFIVGALEETSIEEARRQFETNLFGAMRVTNAVLPRMREEGHGRIVNISSVVGFLPAPYWGAYAASKHALEGYSETLDHEVRGFGVRSILVEPAYTRTKLGGNARFAEREIAAYAAERRRVTEMAQKNLERGDEPRIVAEAVWTALTARSPKLRYPVGQGVLLSLLRRFAPAAIFDRSLRKQFQLA